MCSPLSSDLDRRTFLRLTSVGLIGAGTHALGPTVRGAANERIRLGIIGCGGRGNDLLNEILALAPKLNVDVTAVCDVWRKAAAAAAAKVKQKVGAEPRSFTRFDEVLALEDVDAVTIATPDVAHGPILLAALKAGKDVYVEKPMTIQLEDANQALDLARAKGRVVQVGTQRRSDGRHLAAVKVVAGGSLGPINRVSAAMCVNHPRWRRRSVADCVAEDVDWEAFQKLLPRPVPFDAPLLRQWQLYRLTSNGLPGLWMTHYADAVHMVTGAVYPASAVAHGGIYVWKDGREHADTFHALLEYPEGFLFNWAMGLGNASGIHFTVHGTQATLDLEKGEVAPDPETGPKEPPTKLVALPAESHMENWLQCLRTRERPRGDIQFGHQHAVATILCAEALETGRRQKYDPVSRTISPG